MPFCFTCRFSSILQWQTAAASSTIGLTPSADTANVSAFPERPLCLKLQQFLDLLFRRLAHNVINDDNNYTRDAALRIIKKQDKDAGA